MANRFPSGEKITTPAGRRRGGRTVKLVTVWSDAQSATLMFPRLSNVASKVCRPAKRPRIGLEPGASSVLGTLLALTSHKSTAGCPVALPDAHGQKVASGARRPGLRWWGCRQRSQRPFGGQIPERDLVPARLRRHHASIFRDRHCADGARSWFAVVNDSSPWQSCHR